MLVRNAYSQRIGFRIDEYPAGNEIYRIQHTIEMLRSSENTLLLKMQKLTSGSLFNMKKDCRQHILEILWGWQDLKRLVESLPNSFVDKHFWQDEITAGLKRGSNLYKIFLQRYPLPRLA